MIKIKLVVCTILFLFLLPTSASFSISGLKSESNAGCITDSNLLCSNEKHIIEGVPYVAQSNEDYYCNYATCTMVLQYHGINTTLFEVLHNAGLGYSLSGKPRIIPTITDDFPFPVGFPRSYNCWCGQGTSFGEEDAEFIAQLYGLSCEFTYPNIMINKEICWQRYWQRLKNYILEDLPVCTNIDFTIFPYYVELRNLSGKAYHHSHNILIVGFDEDKGDVYYHDPLCAALTSDEDGTYANVSIEDFKKCVQSVHWLIWNGWAEGYTTLTFRKTGEPYPKETIFKMAHERNIRRMKGCPMAYDKQSARENFHKFGINALKEMKKEFSSIITPLIMPIYPFKRALIKSCFKTSLEKHNVSQYLMEIGDISPVCKYDTLLLEAEATYWDQLISYLWELDQITNNNRYVKTFILSLPLLRKINKALDEIISIEETIIKGS